MPDQDIESSGGGHHDDDRRTSYPVIFFLGMRLVPPGYQVLSTVGIVA